VLAGWRRQGTAALFNRIYFKVPQRVHLSELGVPICFRPDSGNWDGQALWPLSEDAKGNLVLSGVCAPDLTGIYMFDREFDAFAAHFSRRTPIGQTGAAARRLAK
jgi:hypothetical protein